MTTEEKAAAYDAAIKRVENMKTGKCETTFVFTEGLFEYIFPELKESEDERIRKALLEMVHDTIGDSLWVDYNVHKEDAIAWLEKQGEQKSIVEMKSPEESLGIDSDTYNKIVDECIYGEQKPVETEKGAKENEREIPFSEQEWSEDDEQYVKDTLALLSFGCSIHTITQVQDWLKSLKGRVQPQSIAYYNPYKEVVKSIVEMCKHYDRLDVGSLQDFYDNVKVKCKDAKEYESLFPQNTWKPSDEQIHWLKWAINRMPDTEIANEAEAVLEELLEQLKKLREK